MFINNHNYLNLLYAPQFVDVTLNVIHNIANEMK